MKTIGIIGGGQLGLMIAEQARELGVRSPWSRAFDFSRRRSCES